MMANLIIAQLLYLEAEDPIKIFIFTLTVQEGQSLRDGNFDTMQYIKPDVSTICVGMAASMGAFLLAAGEKGKDLLYPIVKL